jgi:hypothetical protein
LVKILFAVLSYLQAWLFTALSWPLLGSIGLFGVSNRIFFGLFYFITIFIMGDTKDFQDSLFFGSMTSTKLKGSNYLQWSRAVRVFLTGHGKESYLTTTKPIDATKIPKWLQEDA